MSERVDPIEKCIGWTELHASTVNEHVYVAEAREELRRLRQEREDFKSIASGLATGVIRYQHGTWGWLNLKDPKRPDGVWEFFSDTKDFLPVLDNKYRSRLSRDPAGGGGGQ